MAEQRIIWQANPGPQELFLAETAFEVLYGGAAGGGKSAALVAYPLRWVHLPGFYSLLLRRESPQLFELVREAQRLYPCAHGEEKVTPWEQWTFPSGAIVRMGHCNLESDARIYQGQEINVLGFDELTHFQESQYQELLTRVRTSNPELPLMVRATTNPGGEGHEWVFRRWGAWLDPEYEIEGLGKSERHDQGGVQLPPAPPCRVLWFQRDRDGERVVKPGTLGALSRTFIPARLEDNPRLVNPRQYEAQIWQHDPVRAEQLRYGDWLVKPAAGLYFQRSWCQFIDIRPAVAERCRFWDLASTEVRRDRRGRTKDPDWTVGVRMARLESGIYIVDDVERFRCEPSEVEGRVRGIAETDGRAVRQGFWQDPGQAGKAQAASYIRLLDGFQVEFFPITGDKATLFGPFSAQAKGGNVRLVRGVWNEPYCRTLERFPSRGEHDDDVDATSGAHLVLAAGTVTRVTDGFAFAATGRAYTVRETVEDDDDGDEAVGFGGSVSRFGKARSL
jgi:predicted phage terminase large subunit-like protein